MNSSLRTKPRLSPVFPHLPLLFMAVLAREGSLHSPHNGTAADSTVVGSTATRCRRPCGRLGPYNTTRFPPSGPWRYECITSTEYLVFVENGVVEDGLRGRRARCSTTKCYNSYRCLPYSASIHWSQERMASRSNYSNSIFLLK